MATRGVNGAAAASLNERFIKCAGCKVNIPKEDMLALGKCTVCGRAYEAEPAGPDAVIIETVAFAPGSDNTVDVPTSTVPQTAQKPKRKRWATLTSKRGRTYYHNTETGEDTWEKPVDFDAEAAADDGFVPFKNDAVKNAVLREQAKMDATKMGLPADVIASLQQRQMENEEQDPLNSMLQRPGQKNAAAAPQTQASLSRPTHTKHNNRYSEHAEGDEEDEEQDQEQDAVGSTAANVKQSSCTLM